MDESSCDDENVGSSRDASSAAEAPTPAGPGLTAAIAGTVLAEDGRFLAFAVGTAGFLVYFFLPLLPAPRLPPPPPLATAEASRPDTGEADDDDAAATVEGSDADEIAVFLLADDTCWRYARYKRGPR